MPGIALVAPYGDGVFVGRDRNPATSADADIVRSGWTVKK
jgi:hypothetical protein